MALSGFWVVLDGFGYFPADCGLLRVVSDDIDWFVVLAVTGRINFFIYRLFSFFNSSGVSKRR